MTKYQFPPKENSPVAESPDFQTSKRRYDLSERTAVFSKEVITFIARTPNTLITEPLLRQLIRSATSIGAQCAEADEASSKRDFINKINIAKKEAKETRYWLELIVHSVPNCKEQARTLRKEAQELNLILAAIVRSAKGKISMTESPRE